MLRGFRRTGFPQIDTSARKNLKTLSMFVLLMSWSHDDEKLRRLIHNELTLRVNENKNDKKYSKNVDKRKNCD